jgi:hypothetical protein
MPKTKLFDIKNLGTWAGIKKKKKKNNGEAEAVQVDRDSDQENVCLPFTFQDYYYADRGQMNPKNTLHHKTRPKNPRSFVTVR